MQHPRLPAAYYWKYGADSGIKCYDGQIIVWPVGMGAMHDETQQAAILAEYEAGPWVAIQTKQANLESQDTAIGGETTLAQLKAMSATEFDDWWNANVTNAAQAIQVLKRLARVVIRRVL